MQQVQAAAVSASEIPMIPVKDRADFCMISIVDGLLEVLHSRSPRKSGRDNRYKAMREKLDEIEHSYRGALPEEFEGFADNCLTAVTEAINKLIVASSETAQPLFKPNGAPIPS